MKRFNSKSKAVKVDVYELVTNKIMDQLKEGTIPWARSWASTGGEPHNPVTGTVYRGINAILLASNFYDTNAYVTFAGAKTLGGTVKRGAKSSIVTYVQMFNPKKDGKPQVDDKGEKVMIPMLKTYHVFNVAQCEGLTKYAPDPVVELDANARIKMCEDIIANIPDRCELVEKVSDRAYYSPSKDVVVIPELKAFNSSEMYYSVLFHELVHSTGHKSRLNRDGIGSVGISFGDEVYSKEELVAEMGSAFLCNIAQIGNEQTHNMSSSYIAGWLKALDNDKRLLSKAAWLGKQASGYILNEDVAVKVA